MMQRGGDEFDCSKNVEIGGVNESEMGLDVFRGMIVPFLLKLSRRSVITV